jgi:signal transduction histidine kinase
MLKKSLEPSGIIFFTDCKENISLALDEIRDLSHRVAPVFFGGSTTEETFRRLFNAFNMDEKSEFLLHVDQAVNNYALSVEMQLNLYRILQEQLRNIQKYANASFIEVDVLIYNHKLKMKISDNGVGFNVNKVKGGIGLANMKRKAELFSGKFEIYSSPGNGCEIIIDMPLPEIK